MAGKGGVWFDTQTQQVVESQPEQGLQLVAPGLEATPDEQAVVKAYREAYNVPGGENETAKTVTTATLKGK